MLLYELPTPVTSLDGEQTHVAYRKIEVQPDEQVRLQGDLGTVDADRNFKPDPGNANGAIVRTISGEEFTDFVAYCDTQRKGAPTEGTSNFRDADLAHWLTTYGWRDQENTWTPSKPPPTRKSP